MRRFMLIGVALTGIAAVMLPLTQAVASSGDAHPPHAERLNAANLNGNQLDVPLVVAAERVSIDRYLVPPPPPLPPDERRLAAAFAASVYATASR